MAHKAPVALETKTINEVYELLKQKVKKVSIAKDPYYNRDFGKCATGEADVIVHVECAEDISNTLAIANEHKIPVTTRGAGHSCNGQTLGRGIILVNYTREPSGELKLLEGNLVQTPTRITWYNLVKFLNKHGLTFPVLTDYLYTSVGGTLSVGGGYNNMSLHHGGQLDHVVRLKLILPSGEALWCSPEENSELFQFSLGGLSTLGVIESVVMRTCPNERFTTYHTKYVEYNDDKDFDDMLNQFVVLTDGDNPPSWAHMGITKYVPVLDSLKKQNIFTRGLTYLANMIYYDRILNSKKYVYIEYGYTYDSILYHNLLQQKIQSQDVRKTCYYYGTLPVKINDREISQAEVDNLSQKDGKAELPAYFTENLLPNENFHFRLEMDKVFNNCDVIEVWLKYILYNKRKLWVDFGLTLENYKKLIEYAKPLFKDNYLQIYIAKIRRPSFSPELPMHLLPKETDVFSLGMYYTTPKNDLEAPKKIKWILNRLMEKCVELGGRPYCYGAVDLNEALGKQIWKEDYNKLLALKKKCDPNNILHSGIIQK